MPRGTLFFAALMACSAVPAGAQTGGTFEYGSDVGGTYQVTVNAVGTECPLDFSRPPYPFEIVQTGERTVQLKMGGDYTTAAFDPEQLTFSGEFPRIAEIGTGARPVAVSGSVSYFLQERSLDLNLRWVGIDCTASASAGPDPIPEGATPGSQTAPAPPATVIGPAGPPPEEASAPVPTPESADQSSAIVTYRWLLLIGAPIVGWVIGSALRPRGARQPAAGTSHALARTPAAPPPQSLTAWQWAVLPLRKYADFTGRAPPREYWLFVLLVLAASIAVGFVQGALGMEAWYGLGTLRLILMAAVFLPGLAVAVRRLHDTGRSGVTLLLGLVPIIGGLVVLVLLILPGTEGPNRYGPKP